MARQVRWTTRGEARHRPMVPPLTDLSGIVCRGCNARSVSNECRAAYAMSPCLFPSYRQSRGYRTHFSRRIWRRSSSGPIYDFSPLTSFQSVNRPSLSLGSSSRSSLLKQSFSVSFARRRPPGNIHSRSRLLLTNKTRPRFAATSLDDFAIPGPCCSRTNRQR